MSPGEVRGAAVDPTAGPAAQTDTGLGVEGAPTSHAGFTRGDIHPTRVLYPIHSP